MFIISVAGIFFNILVALALGVHGHLGHTHDHSSGGCGGHSHGHAHDHEHSHAEEGEEEHAEQHGHAHKHGSCSGHGHDHEEHAHGSHKQQAAAKAPAAAAAGLEDSSVAIVVPAAACIGDSHIAECKCFIQQTGLREIEVRCELPLGAALASAGAGAGARPASSCAGSGGGDHGHSHGHEHGDNINLRGAVLHVIGDLVQSVGVAIAGLLIWFHQEDARWYIADPICTFLFSVLVLWTTKNIMSDIFAVLMERAPMSVNPAQVGPEPAAGVGVSWDGGGAVRV